MRWCGKADAACLVQTTNEIIELAIKFLMIFFREDAIDLKMTK